MRKPNPEPVPVSIPLVVLDVHEDGTVTPFAPLWRSPASPGTERLPTPPPPAPSLTRPGAKSCCAAPTTEHHSQSRPRR
ncbi:hypothetical protein FH975_00690 [Nesterenkonia sp. Hz 6-5]|nr:hypothetical protein [Nesterenkonia haasae]